MELGKYPFLYLRKKFFADVEALFIESFIVPLPEKCLELFWARYTSKFIPGQRALLLGKAGKQYLLLRMKKWCS